MRDVTVSRQAGEQMQAALLREQELNRLRNEFITMASHEFRTPLAGIMHSAEILKEYGHDLLPAKRDRYHGLILGGAKRIDNLIEEVLILGKTQAGRLTCRPHSLDLRAFVDRCLSELPINAASIARVRVSLNLAKDTHPLDAALLRHSLMNLLANGLKYSGPDKPVDLRIGDQDGRLLIIEVEDYGIGVPPKDLPDLFTPFHRGSNIGNVKGSGVGLSIVKSCVDVHRGTIDVVSEVDKGSKFTVRIPITPPDHSSSNP
jgi:signal transduction histidine kinase